MWIADKSKYIIFSLIALSIVLFFSLGYCSWPVADDYSNYNAYVKIGNPLIAASHLYFSWTGRFVSSLLLNTAFFILGVEKLNIVSGLLGACVVLLSFQIASIISVKPSKISYWVSAAIIPVLWFGLQPIIGQVVFWATGGIVYLVPLLLGLFWCQIIKKITLGSTKETTGSNFNLIICSIFSLIVGNGMENLSPALLAYGLGLVFFRWRQISTYSKRVSVAMILNAFIGTLILILAPGNFERAKHGKQSFGIELKTLLGNYFTVLNKYIDVNTVLLSFIFILLGLLPILMMISVIKSKYRLNTDIDKLKTDVCHTVILFVAAFSTIIPMILVPDFVEPRTSLYFVIFLFIAVLSSALSVLSMFNLDLSRLIIYLMLAILTANGFFSYNIIRDIYSTVAINKQFNLRQEFMQNNINNDILVPAIEGSKPKSLHFNDVTRDPNNWVNLDYATYYKLRSIAITY